MKCPKCGYDVGEVKPTPQHEIDQREVAKEYFRKIARQEFSKEELNQDPFGVNEMINALVKEAKKQGREEAKKEFEEKSK